MASYYQIEYFSTATFDLASTTVTNIPMKEEQHANTSAHYDVELLHHKDAHVDFLKSGDTHLGGSRREVGTRGKGPKRDEQYRIMWNGSETLVRAHINNSEKHQRVLECLMTYRSKPPEEEEFKKRGRKREDKEDKSEKAVKDHEQEKPWQDSERLKGILERGKEELAEAEIIKDSPDSPEPPNKKAPC
ncbi:Hypothetical predicted protein [Marmota monax]|uniref:Uncharacterized protein n=1 Tax=Marmota monax TaxID=9995 RepID=A0A5E4ABZ9_MARMO|nr:hypothetical protein GHT09_003852 [Marmota monax]VTJ54847.1 Hypothetical predicted protein [Marmota monax]